MRRAGALVIQHMRGRIRVALLDDARLDSTIDQGSRTSRSKPLTTECGTQGDGSMLAFSSARQAVACAQAIQLEIERAFGDLAPPIRVRIGVHTGDAIKDAGQYIGSTVHFAARVAGQAIGGEVLVSSAVYELVHASTPAVMFLEGREVELKGVAGRHRVYALAPA